jgi:hypothetical protein
MTPRDLQTLVTELHDQLHTARAIDPESRRRLQLLAEEMRAYAAAGSTRPGPNESQDLRDRLAKAVIAFESSHPELSRTIEGLIDTLGQHTL